MKLDEVLPRDGLDGRVLGYARVGAVRAIEKLRELAARDFADIVVAAGDCRSLLDLGELDLVLGKRGVPNQVREDLEDEGKILFEGEERRAPRRHANIGFDHGAFVLEESIDFITRFGFPSRRCG